MDTSKQLSLDEELLTLLASQARVSPFNMLAAMGIIAYLIYPHVPDRTWLLTGWLLLVAISQFYRRYRLLQLPAQHQRTASERKREAAGIQIVCSGIMALCFLAFPLLTPFEASLMTMFFIAMGVGSIVACIGWPPYSKAHIFGHLIPLFALWGWSGYAGPGGTAAYLCALIGLSYSATMWRFSRQLFQMNQKFFSNRTALSQALKDAETANKAKSRFLAAASHDLRQPVHALTLLSATLKRQALGDRVSDISATMDDAITALSNELEALLDISKLDAGVVGVNKTNFDLQKILLRIVHELHERATAKSIHLLLESSEPVFCYTDQVLLERIVRNILENAIVHNSDCDVILGLKSMQSVVQLSIEDTGSGIATAEQTEIFEEFYQLNNPARDQKIGLGLGLSIVKRLQLLLALDMHFFSELGQGTRFHFSIPSGGIPIESDRSQPAKNTHQDSQILVIDDEESVRLAMTYALEALGYKVEAVDGKKRAVESITMRVPDIALVDFRLGNVDNGIEVVKALRELIPELPAIIITGDTSPLRLREIQEAGLAFLHKPVMADALSEAIALNLVSKDQGA